VPDLPCLLRSLTYQTKCYPGFLGHGAEGRIAAPTGELLSVIFDTARHGSLAATIDTLLRVARQVRDRISIDMWRTLSSLDLHDDAPHDGRARPRPGPIPVPAPRAQDVPMTLGEVLDLLDRKVLTLMAFSGLVAEGMTRGQGWRFLDIGRRLERSLHTLGLLRTTLATMRTPEGPILEALLEIADSTMTYRRRYMSSLQTAPVLDLLLADENNPRALAYQLVTLASCLASLPQTDPAQPESPELPLVQQALARLRAASLDALSKVDAAGHRPALETLLVGLEADIPHLSDALTRNYLTHLQAARQYASWTI
jgi:uncharacterized alpha-E superfamily protein